ncbi:MAG: NAD(P)H-binding protein [Sphingomonas sp.]
MIVALTGATGFVGGHLIDLARAEGHQVRALTRRAQPARPDVIWVEGALDRPLALGQLIAGTDAVIHVAGVVNAGDRAAFERGNVDGTRAMVLACEAAGIRRFVHVSSLAAREPALSDYGWSKAGAEEAVTSSALDWTIVRPPAVYGPGDMEMFDIFRMARLGVALMPPPGRMSVIHVNDLVRLLLALAVTDPGRVILEPDDGTVDGWSHADFARAVGQAIGKRVTPLALPRSLLALAARADRLVRGPKAKLTLDRVGYMCHPDWTANPARQPPAALWAPRIATPTGLRETAEDYHAKGLL